MKNFLATFISAACIVVFAVFGYAAQLSFPGTDSSHSEALGTDKEPFASVFPIAPDGSLEAVSSGGLAPFIPIQLDQFVISLLDVSGGEDAIGESGFPQLSSFSLNTGIETGSYLTDPQAMLMNELFGSDADSFTASSSIVFVGVGFDVKSLYLGGNAYVGRPIDTLSTSLRPVQSPESVKDKGIDTDAYGFEASAGYQFNNMIALGASVGKMTDKNRETDETEEIYAVYAQALLAIAPGVQVRPEVGKVDRVTEKQASDTEEIDKDFYAGAIWEINF